MSVITQILIGVILFGILIFVFELVRRKKLKEEYSIIWLFTCFIALILSQMQWLLFKVSDLVGAENPLAIFYFLAISFIVVIILHFSTKITKLETNNKELVEEIGLLKNDLARLSKQEQS